MDKVRCPACRGTKKVPKLGGIIGDCNTCNGEGQIKAADMPVAVAPVVVTPAAEVVQAVSVCAPSEIIAPAKDVRIDPKKAIYKRKRA